MMSVSVLIPSFNAAKYIRLTLQSVIENMEDGDEVILVDDHSTDESIKVARSILQNAGVDYKAAINPLKGACSARNHAFSLSKNPLIQWLDSDDILGKNKLRIQRAMLEGNPNSIVASPFVPFIGDPKSGAIPEDRNWPSSAVLTGADWLASERMTIPACWFGPRHIFEKAGPWDTQLKINQDGEYFTRVLTVAESVIFTPNVNVWYRRGNSESVSRFTAEKATSLFTSVDSIHRAALTMEDSDRMRQMVANLYQHAIYTAYPYCSSGMEKAKKTLKELPKPTVSNPNAVSLLSKFISFVFGWKTLTRLRLMRKQLKQ